MFTSNRLHSLKDLADRIPSLQETVLQDYHRSMAKTHEEFLIGQFEKKKMGHLVPNKFTLFPKIASVQANKWTFWFADDGDGFPKFIVAISDWETITGGDPMACTMTMHFNYIPDYASAEKLAPELFNQIFKF